MTGGSKQSNGAEIGGMKVSVGWQAKFEVENVSTINERPILVTHMKSSELEKHAMQIDNYWLCEYHA